MGANPVREVPVEALNWNSIDCDEYKYGLLNSIQLAQDSAKELNERYRERMKTWYDKRNRVEPEKLPRVRERAYVKLPKEEASSRYPMFCNDWHRPYRKLEVSENSALVTHVKENEDPIRAQFDLIVRVQAQIDDTPLQSKTKRCKRRKRGQYKETEHQCCTSTCDATTLADNHALSLFFTCPRTRFGEGSIEEQSSCIMHVGLICAYL